MRVYQLAAAIQSPERQSQAPRPRSREKKYQINLKSQNANVELGSSNISHVLNNDVPGDIK
jgi:hypothetical protein